MSQLKSELELFVDENNRRIVLQIGDYHAYLTHAKAQNFGLGFLKAALHLEMLINGELIPPNDPPN